MRDHLSRIKLTPRKTSAPKRRFSKRNQADLARPALPAKIFCFRFSEICGLFAHPAPMKGDVSADRHEPWGGDAMDAGRHVRRTWRTRTAKSRGPGPPTLGSSLRVTSSRATEAKEHDTPGRSPISRKPLRRECRRVFGCTCRSLVCVLSATCCTRDRGCNGTRHSLCPLRFFEGGRRCITRARTRRGNAEVRLQFVLAAVSTSSSCPASCRASTSWSPRKKDVDGRDKPGHDEDAEAITTGPGLSILSCPGLIRLRGRSPFGAAKARASILLRKSLFG